MKQIQVLNEIPENQQPRRFKGNNIIWIILLVIILYVFVAAIFDLVLGGLVIQLNDWSPSMHFILECYTGVIWDIATLAVVILVVRKNWFIGRSFLPAGRERRFRIRVIEDTYIASNDNTVRMLLLGLALGFITNFFCIACALLHGDIKLYFDFSASQIPVLIFAFISVFIQSTGEELWCRGYMYERILIHYPVWVAVAVNGIFFGLLHSFNPGVSVMAVVGIAICGLSYSLVRWYTGSIWVTMGIHTMWNFTQNIIFGLPNSGLVSEMSIFHLDASTGISNLIYDYAFGVEAAIPALLADGILGVAVVLLAKRDGRLGELALSYEKLAAMQQKTAVTQADTEAPETEDIR
ncbi:MAG: CPBP family intramembrane metalloprotease [Mogibacterium sp.]|nr:CPBP family intramembrane metalloprotease [Mogibacterium sp.]